MNQSEAVPSPVHEAARRLYLKSGRDEDRRLLREWAEQRYPGFDRTDDAAAFWALSLGFCYGVDN